MNDTPGHLDDEVLSALLDGAAAGGQLPAAGTDPVAHLEACDRCAGRQQQLAAARAALASAPTGPVDELTRRRLVAAALEAADDRPAGGAVTPLRARSHWSGRRALIGSAAAVVLAVLVGIPFVMDDDGASEKTSTLAAGAPGSAQLAAAYLGDLGDLADRESLRLRLGGSPPGDQYTGGSAPLEPGPAPPAGGRSPGPVAAATPEGGMAGSAAKPRTMADEQRESAPLPVTADSGVAQDAAADQGFAAESSPRRDADRTAIDTCVAQLLNGPAQGGRLTASGTGTFEGRPAIVAVFDLAGGRMAFITDRAGCAVLDRFPV